MDSASRNTAPAGPGGARREPGISAPDAADPEDLFVHLLRKDRLILELKEALAERDGRIVELERTVADARRRATGGGPAGPGMPSAYARMLSDRVAALAGRLAALEADLLTAAAAPGSAQHRLAMLFATPHAEGRTVQPQEKICPSWNIGFEPTASVRLTVRPNGIEVPALDSYGSSIEVILSGQTRWLTFGTTLAWDEIVDAEDFDAAAAGEPDRSLDIYLCLRLWQSDGGFVQHFFGGLKLDPQSRQAGTSGPLNLPDPAMFDGARAPVLLLFLSPPQDGLQVRLDHISLSFR